MRLSRLWNNSDLKVNYLMLMVGIDEFLVKEDLMKVLKALDAEELIKEISETGMGSQYWE